MTYCGYCGREKVAGSICEHLKVSHPESGGRISLEQKVQIQYLVDKIYDAKVAHDQARDYLNKTRQEFQDYVNGL